ncbi:hypothetical protein DKX38_021083 [Salix brachista]|uniref:Uncharacterized protein n=1 Tax=Salix brachista TaxID=2182728 RepID=A0A5N5K8G6_9ROSI|nr:hypothetical protein DKX38_021083 [Salix brachista]
MTPSIHIVAKNLMVGFTWVHVQSLTRCYHHSYLANPTVDKGFKNRETSPWLSDQASFPPIVASMEGFLKGLIMGFCMYTGYALKRRLIKLSPQCGIWMPYFSGVKLDLFLEEQYAGKISCFQFYDHNFPWCDWYVYNLTRTLWKLCSIGCEVEDLAGIELHGSTKVRVRTEEHAVEIGKMVKLQFFSGMKYDDTCPLNQD